MVEYKGEKNLHPWGYHWATKLTCPRAVTLSDFLLREIMFFVDSKLHFLFIVQHLWNQNVFCYGNIIQSLLARGSPDTVVTACSCVHSMVISSGMTDSCNLLTVQSTNHWRTLELGILVSVWIFSIDTFWREKESIVIKTSIMSVSAWKKIQEEIMKQSFKKGCITNTLISQRIILGRKNVDINTDFKE